MDQRMMRPLVMVSLLVVSALVRVASAETTSGPKSAGAAEDASHAIEQMLTARTDDWAEAAIKQPEGPSYEYFASLLPPLRYVDAPFRVYPITLSAPGAHVKARLVGDGRGINLLARQPNWRGETGVPVVFRLGQNRVTFGEDPVRLDGPRYADGYLPIVQMSYRHADALYLQESFADVQPDSASHGVALIKFSLTEGKQGKVEAQFESATPLKRDGAALRNEQGKVITSQTAPWPAFMANSLRGSRETPSFAQKGATSRCSTSSGD